MERDKDYETGCFVFILFTCMIIAMCRACSYNNDLKKVRSENRLLKRDIENARTRISDLESLNKDYKWQLEQVPYIIEYWCKGE